ncbi:hypothetical protein BN2476_610048 [Paraburkholderia piptadeniae]|uniref:Uncharacterized protein n=1 Tax=Paraburkholderia piptadeniae TaxID=1701573 RepID=A0A1N7SKV8_9BURK|nr:hypothetical protein BN2476_610048 [Paraburkholderia piptadeniae]
MSAIGVVVVRLAFRRHRPSTTANVSSTRGWSHIFDPLPAALDSIVKKTANHEPLTSAQMRSARAFE